MTDKPYNRFFIYGLIVFGLLWMFFLDNSKILACSPPSSTCCAVLQQALPCEQKCIYSKICALPQACTGNERPFWEWCIDHWEIIRCTTRYPTSGCIDGGDDGGGGGGNNPPSCTITAPDTITYDGKKYLDPATGTVQTSLPSSQSGTVNLSDPDGDSVSITNLTVSKPQCLQVQRNNTTLTLTPQGQLTGQTPTLDTSYTCQVQITAQISDGNGGTNNCSKTITVTYPAPRMASLRLYDRNPNAPAGFDSQPANPLQDTQFVYIGGAHQDPFTTTGAKLQNPTSPLRDLLPPNLRFDITGYSGSDHNPLRVVLKIYDPNGNQGGPAGFGEFAWELAQLGGSGRLPLLTTGTNVWDGSSKMFRLANRRRSESAGEFRSAAPGRCFGQAGKRMGDKAVRR